MEEKNKMTLSDGSARWRVGAYVGKTDERCWRKEDYKCSVFIFYVKIFDEVFQT